MVPWLHHHWPHNGDSINTTRALPSFQLPSCLAWLYQEQCKLISNRQNLRPELKVIFIFILNIFAAKRSAMLESSCLWRDFIIKLVWTVLRMSSVTPLIKLILLLYRINTTILSGQEDEHSHRNTLSPLMIWSGCMKFYTRPVRKWRTKQSILKSVELELGLAPRILDH